MKLSLLSICTRPRDWACRRFMGSPGRRSSRRRCANFPRSLPAGIFLMALGTLWFLWNVEQESIADFASFKPHNDDRLRRDRAGHVHFRAGLSGGARAGHRADVAGQADGGHGPVRSWARRRGCWSFRPGPTCSSWRASGSPCRPGGCGTSCNGPRPTKRRVRVGSTIRLAFALLVARARPDGVPRDVTAPPAQDSGDSRRCDRRFHPDVAGDRRVAPAVSAGASRGPRLSAHRATGA